MSDLPSRAAVRYALTKAGFKASERRRMTGGTFWSPGFRVTLVGNEAVRVYVEIGSLPLEPGAVHARALRLRAALANRGYTARIVLQRSPVGDRRRYVDYIDVKNSA